VFTKHVAYRWSELALYDFACLRLYSTSILVERIRQNKFPMRKGAERGEGIYISGWELGSRIVIPVTRPWSVRICVACCHVKAFLDVKHDVASLDHQQGSHSPFTFQGLDFSLPTSQFWCEVDNEIELDSK
jgi:hypothetical protein